MSTLTPTDATRILRAWEKANAGANVEPQPTTCDRCDGELRYDTDGRRLAHRCADDPRVDTCPVCELRNVPICPDGQFAAHGWARGGELSEGDLDADGWSTPGEWSGCANRDPNAAPNPAPYIDPYGRDPVRDDVRLTCPVCGERGIPVNADGRLAAHAWIRGRLADDAGDDVLTDDTPVPSRWVGGCENRAPTLTPAPKPDTL